MAHKHRFDGAWFKNAAGVYVQGEPISAALVASASTGQVVAKKSDGTLELITASGGGGGPITPDSTPDTPDAMDDEFDTGSAIDTGLWTGFNTTDLANSVNDGALVLGISTPAENIRGYLQTLPVASSWRFRLKVTADGVVRTNSSLAGIVLRESGTGKLLVFGSGYSGGDDLLIQRWTNVTTWGATLSTVSPVIGTEGIPYYLDIELSGSNYLCRYSYSGAHFTSHATVALTTPFTTAADEVGVFMYNNSASNNARGVFEFFRRIA